MLTEDHAVDAWDILSQPVGVIWGLHCPKEAGVEDLLEISVKRSSVVRPEYLDKSSGGNSVSDTIVRMTSRYVKLIVRA